MYRRQSAYRFITAKDALSGSRSRVVALFADLRGFSNWSETQSLDQVAELVKAQVERVMDICGQHHHPFHKFLGDGFVLLWEPEGDDDLPRCLASALDATFELHNDYLQRSGQLNFQTPAGYGVGISVGDAIRIDLGPLVGNSSAVDFVGYPLNCAARMQTLASGFGTIVCSSAAQMLESDPGRFLHTTVPGVCRRLVEPDEEMLDRAAVTKGLKPVDRTGFRRLSFTDDQDWAWRASGLPQ